MLDDIAAAQSVSDLAALLRRLLRRYAHAQGAAGSSYRAIDKRTGWGPASISDYFTGKTFPPPAKFDALVELLGASPAERHAMANAYDRAAESRRHAKHARRAPTRQLPPDVPGFAGRHRLLAWLDDHLDGAAPDGPTVLVLSGMAGVGKTSLAVRWAHRAAAWFPGGQLFVDLQGFGPTGSTVDPLTALREFLDALGAPVEGRPTTIAGLSALYRGLLADQRVLVVLDNARDPAQVRPLLPSGSGCLVLVTSRSQLTGLVATDGARLSTLDTLSAIEARELLAHRLGTDLVAAEPDAVDTIISGCAGLPLALGIVAAHAVAQPHLPLADLAGEIRDTRPDLEPFADADPTADVRAVMSWSYRALDAGAARTFRLLGAHCGPDISRAAVASLTATALPAVRTELAELVATNLVTPNAAGRYTMHDLVRAHALEQASGVERAAATHRVLDHYVHTAYAAAQLLDPHRKALDLAPPQPGVTPEPIADQAAARAWFAAEYRVLLAAVKWCAGTRGWDSHLWPLVWSMSYHLDRSGLWPEWAEAAQAATAATERLGDPAAQARMYLILAFAHLRLGDVDSAQGHLKHTLDLTAAEDGAGRGHIHMTLGEILDGQGQHAEALEHAQQALELFRAGDHRAEEAEALNAVGWLYAQHGDHERALVCCGQSLAAFTALGDRDGQAAAWDSIAFVHGGLGDHTRALDGYRRALALLTELGDRYHEARVLVRIGDLEEDPTDAWLRALSILEDLAHPDAAEVREKLSRASAGHAHGQRADT